MKCSTWIIVAILALVLVCLAPGCDGSGGMGGQGFYIVINQNGPGAVESSYTGPDGQKATGGNVSVVNLNAKDGGTNVGPLSPQSADSSEEPPKESPTPPDTPE